MSKSAPAVTLIKPPRRAGAVPCAAQPRTAGVGASVATAKAAQEAARRCRANTIPALTLMNLTGTRRLSATKRKQSMHSLGATQE